MFKNVEIMEPESFPKTEKEARLCWKFLLPSWKVTFFWIENRFSELASSNSTYIYCCLESEGHRTNEGKWKCKRMKSWTIRKASKIFRLLITSIKLDRTLFPGWVNDHFDQVAIRHFGRPHRNWCFRPVVLPPKEATSSYFKCLITTSKYLEG